MDTNNFKIIKFSVDKIFERKLAYERNEFIIGMYVYYYHNYVC